MVILGDGVEILYSHLDSKIGNPVDIVTNLESKVNFDVEYDIPFPMQIDGG